MMPHKRATLPADSPTAEPKWPAGNRLNWLPKVCLPILSVTLLFCGFYWNLWAVADQKWFVDHRYDCEALVIGRLVKSRQEGVFAAAGFTGLGNFTINPVSWRDAPFEKQFSAYLNGLTFEAYTPYLSQIGGQGMLFSILDKIIPASPGAKLQIYSLFYSLLTAVVLTMIVLWFSAECGWFAALAVLGSLLMSQWLVVLGRNLFLSVWVFYLPMVVVMYYLKYNTIITNNKIAVFAILVFVAVLIKCIINTFEYITTTLIMMGTPIIYCSVKNKDNIRWFIKTAVVAVLSSLLAILLSLVILICQIGTLQGYDARNNKSWKGVSYIIDTIKRRTYPDELGSKNAEAGSLEARFFPTVWAYLYGKKGWDGLSAGTFFSSKNYEIRFIYLIFIFLIASFSLYLFNDKGVYTIPRGVSVALIWATWFSLMAPLSWIIFFKQHSYVHFHLNYIVWHMPFTFFGFALCGLAAKNLGRIIGNKLGY
jgi:hypothetical protein